MWRTGARLTIALVVGVPLLLLGAFVTAVALTPLPAAANPESTELLDASGNRISLLFKENRVEIPVTEMPPYLLNAVVAVEDERFYTHHGIDPVGLARAMVRNLVAGQVVQGGSTLTQQLAKNLYLTQERTLTRKVKEAVLTVKLESVYSKKEILGMYWNTIYLGSGAYGVEVAAETYFGKPARDMTLAEAALLAGLPRSPEYYSPFVHPDYAVKRRDLVLDKMVTAGYITAAQAEKARAEPLHLAQQQTARQKSPEAPYFVDYVVRELQQRFPDVYKNLYTEAYRIYTTLDLPSQRQANAAVQAAFPQGNPQPQAALVAIDPANGYIRALVGGRGQNVDLNRVLEPQQPGSAFKPFVYATALDTRNYTVLSTQMDAPAEFPGATAGSTWKPQNFGNKYSYQPATMREALRKSLNVVTVEWMNTLKPGPVIDLAKRMGIESKLESNLTIGLGSSEVTPLELTRAYAPLANGGYAVKPLAILKVTDRAGNTIAQDTPSRQPVLDPGVAYIVTDMLKGVLGPGGTAAGIGGYIGGRPAAGKTGTSDESRDLWFVGYTPDLVTGVWVGSDENTPLQGEGGSVAAPIWGRFMSGAVGGKQVRDWTPPDDVESRDICTLTGLLPNASCPVGREWFLKGTAPTQVDPTVHWDHVVPGLPGLPGAASAPSAPDTPAVPGTPGAGGAAPGAPTAPGTPGAGGTTTGTPAAPGTPGPGETAPPPTSPGVPSPSPLPFLPAPTR